MKTIILIFALVAFHAFTFGAVLPDDPAVKAPKPKVSETHAVPAAPLKPLIVPPPHTAPPNHPAPIAGIGGAAKPNGKTAAAEINGTRVKPQPQPFPK